MCSTGRGCTVQAEGNSLLCIPQPVYCTSSACLLHTLTLYTTTPCTLHSLTLYTAHPHSVYCTPSLCILHTLTLYIAHPHSVLHMYLIQGGPVGLTSYINTYDGDFDAFEKGVHKDCFQKCINKLHI